jgi:hypothetical protein
MAKVVFRADSPIHIGWHKLGFVDRTRLYIHGRAIWGALAERIAAECFRNDGVPGMYHAAQQMCKRSLRFTYFFPTDQPNGSVVWFPRFSGSGAGNSLRYGNRTIAELEAAVVFSDTSTAIAATSFSAQSGALHETEYLAHEWFDIHKKSIKRLYFAGFIFYRDDNDWCGDPETKLRHILSQIQIGGDRRYGRGRLSLVDYRKDTAGCFFDAFQVNPQSSFGEDLIVTAIQSCDPRDIYLPAHVSSDRHTNNLKLTGELEAVSGLDWSDSFGSGQSSATLRHCWTPGSKLCSSQSVNCDLDAGSSWIIDTYGFWHGRENTVIAHDIHLGQN